MLKLDDRTIKKSLKDDGIQRLYFVAGNDEFLIDACSKAVITAIFGEGERNLTVFDAEKTEAEELEEFFLSFSLISENKVAVFDGFQLSALNAERIKLLTGLFTEIPSDITVIIKSFSDTENKRFSVNKTTESFVANIKKSAIVTVLQKSGTDILGYIEKIAAREGATISDKNASHVAELCANDLLLINNEIIKLAAYADYGEIKAEHIEKLCIRTAESGVYDMISFIERNDTRNAIRVLSEMLDERTAPLAISSALNTAFINLYRARLARDEKKGEAALFSLFDYKKGDRKVSIAYERSGRYTQKQLAEIINILYGLDVKLKSSVAEKRYILEEGIIKVARKVGAR